MAAPATVPYPKTRRIRFGFGDPVPMRRHFADNDIALSHVLAGASAVFPPGEEFFVRSVRRYADRITEPTLKKRVAGFIGQEVTHGLHHRELNEKLTEMGYRSKMVENIGRRSGKVEDLVDKYLPNMDRLKYVRLTMLAATAALEHYTAVLAERLLESSELQDMVTDDEVRNLLYWHAIEELEHKSVAFDVYRAVGGPEWLRRAVMAVIWTGTVPFATVGSWFSIAWSDPDGRRQPGRVLRETLGLIRGPLLNDGMIGRLAVYMKKDFHPDDLDTDTLLDQWRAELFGADGTLVDHLK
ncbi:Predicted metal-dependent hydrolase [Mycobacteroides abscessus subsp. massiliense]|uniref:metal-dependent hydrolase n=1 Tax=Mycobacteroides abscessus TaxID=36809 RepID=UPI0009A78609|nr:metal-dependent hydrolase [Mycobacteroides abscessus]SKU55132.1 Predicted metal-dependent hydrolase [Mycobacteroides abscessus subsp. massiliense]